MGLFRTILALLVVCSHLRPIGQWPLILATGGAIFAVKAFFIVSGFYMAMVLHKRYQNRPLRDFYASRFARLLPLYWLVGGLTIVAEYFLVAPGRKFYPLVSPLGYGAGLDLKSLPIFFVLYIAISVLTMIGLDTGQWLGFNRVGGHLSIFPDYESGATSVMALSPIPIAWSISVELWFYLIAPFLVGRSLIVIAALAVGSLGFRFAMASLGFDGEPWSRALFPSELIFFMMGVAAFRLYLGLPTLKIPYTRLWRFAPIAVALVISPIFNVIHHYRPDDIMLATAPYILVALGIPHLFDCSKASTIDTRIGNLSYPIYVGHMFVMGMVQLTVPTTVVSAFGAGWTWLVANLLCVIAFAFLLDHLVAAPIDQWRRRFGARTRQEADTPPVEVRSALN